MHACEYGTAYHVNSHVLTNTYDASHIHSHVMYSNTKAYNNVFDWIQYIRWV